MAAANDTFTVKIKTMTGEEILIPNVTMDSTVERLKIRFYVNYTDMGHDVPLADIRLFYMTNPGFIELVTGILREYSGIIDFTNPETELDMLLQPIEHHQLPAATLADLVESENLVDVPENATVVHELSSDLNFKTIYISDDKKKGLKCKVKYISVNDRVKTTILDVDIPDGPDIRLYHTTAGGISSTLLSDYVQYGLVFVEEPVHGGRKKRTRRTRRKLHKKRTYRKRHNHKRMSR
jgi:hypothetical protein